VMLAFVQTKPIFYAQHSRLRVVSEQVIGHVKARFGSMKELRVSVNSMEDVKRGGDWIIATVTMHNLCGQLRDYEPPTSSKSFRCSNSAVVESPQQSNFINRQEEKSSKLRKMLLHLSKKEVHSCSM